MQRTAWIEQHMEDTVRRHPKHFSPVTLEEDL